MRRIVSSIAHATDATPNRMAVVASTSSTSSAIAQVTAKIATADTACDWNSARRMPGSNRSRTVSESPIQPVWMELTVIRMPNSRLNVPSPAAPSWRSTTSAISRLVPATIICDTMAPSGRRLMVSSPWSCERWSYTTPMRSVRNTSSRWRTMSRSRASVPRSTIIMTPSDSPASAEPSATASSGGTSMSTNWYRSRSVCSVARAACERNRPAGSSTERPPVTRSRVASPPTPIDRWTSSIEARPARSSVRPPTACSKPNSRLTRRSRRLASITRTRRPSRAAATARRAIVSAASLLGTAVAIRTTPPAGCTAPRLVARSWYAAPGGSLGVNSSPVRLGHLTEQRGVETRRRIGAAW